MSTSTKEDRQEAARQARAISALEGIEQDAEGIALTKSYIDGDLSTQQIIDILTAKYSNL